MKLFISILFFSFISLHCAKKKDSTQIDVEHLCTSHQSCNDELLRAISSSNFVKAKALLEAGANPNYRNKDGIGPPVHSLIYADNEQGSAEFLPILFNYGADINAKNGANRTALAQAIEIGKYRLAQALIQNDNIDLKDNGQGESILYTFYLYKIDLTNSDALQAFNMILSKADADLINTKDRYGDTVLANALDNRNYLLAQALLQNYKTDISIKDNESGESILHIFGNIDLTNSLALQTLNMILSKAADLIDAKNKEGKAPLHLAVENKNIDFLKALASRHNIINIDIENNKRYTPLLRSILNEDLQATKILLDAGANPHHHSITNNGTRTAFHLLPYTDNEQENRDFVPLLLNHGVDINAQNERGYTALAYAIERRKFLLAQKILQTGNIDLSKKDIFGDNVIHTFSSVNWTRPLVLQTFNMILSKADADVINAKNRLLDMSPLELAIFHHNMDVLKTLVSHPHVNINIKGAWGMPRILSLFLDISRALDEALSSPKEETSDISQLEKVNQVLQILLSSPHEIDFTMIDIFGRSPYNELLAIKEKLLQLPKDSPFYSSFEAIKQTLASIDTH